MPGTFGLVAARTVAFYDSTLYHGSPPFARFTHRLFCAYATADTRSCHTAFSYVTFFALLLPHTDVTLRLHICRTRLVPVAFHILPSFTILRSPRIPTFPRLRFTRGSVYCAAFTGYAPRHVHTRITFGSVAVTVLVTRGLPSHTAVWFFPHSSRLVAVPQSPVAAPALTARYVAPVCTAPRGLWLPFVARFSSRVLFVT